MKSPLFIRSVVFRWSFPPFMNSLYYTDWSGGTYILTDETPYRWIPPAMYEDIKDVLDAGAIRELQSPFSSNVFLIRNRISLFGSVSTIIETCYTHRRTEFMKLLNLFFLKK